MDVVHPVPHPRTGCIQPWVVVAVPDPVLIPRVVTAWIEREMAVVVEIVVEAAKAAEEREPEAAEEWEPEAAEA